jgi:hypothetical protein
MMANQAGNIRIVLHNINRRFHAIHCSWEVFQFDTDPSSLVESRASPPGRPEMDGRDAGRSIAQKLDVALDFLGGAAVHRCDNRLVFRDGFSR